MTLKEKIEQSFIENPNKWRDSILYVNKILNEKLNTRSIYVDSMKYNIFCRIYLAESLRLDSYLQSDKTKKTLTDDEFHNKVISSIILNETINSLVRNSNRNKTLLK